MKDVVAACLKNVEATDDGFRAAFRFPTELEVFLGHFPGMPLVPGVFLIEAVRCAAEVIVDHPLRIARVTDAKFTAAVRPDVPVTVRAVFDGDKCSAIVSMAGADAAQVRLVLTASASG